MLTTLYKSIVRPHLEYGSNIWSVMHTKEAIQIENVQRRATKLVKNIQHLSYSDRLRYLGWMRSIIPTAHNSDSPLFRQPITPTAHYSDGPFFRQCKIELNPQIHGLTRCIQQDVPSIRLILTDHGLDRMFWKGKGAFILGCTSPFKAIMIVRPGMGSS